MIRMMREILLLLAALFAVQFLPAQILDSLFVNAPSQVLPLLDRNVRLNMLDYYNSGMDATGENLLGGSSAMTLKNDSILKIRTTEASEFEMVWLKDRGLIVCLQTLLLPVRQSYLDVYDEKWQKQRMGLPVYDVKDFFVGSEADFTSEEFKPVLNALTPMHYTLAWSSKNDAFICTPSLERLVKELQPIATKNLHSIYVKLNVDK